MPRNRWLKRLSPEAQLTAQVWLLSRGMIALTAAVVMARTGSTAGMVLRRWDVLHFMGIARSAYANPSDVAFFPGLPMLLRAGQWVGLPMEATGVIVALVGSALATAALFRMFGAPAACLWCLAPTAVFTAVGYSEAAFCAAAFWAWQRADKGRWWQAAGLAGVACAFRVTGLFLVGALGVLAIVQVARDGERGRRAVALLARWAWLLIPLAVLGAYEVYMFAITGSWRAWLDAEQANWSRGLTWPWDAFRHTWQAGWPRGGADLVAWVFRGELVSMAVGVAVTVWCVVKRRWAEAAFVAVQVLAFGTSFWYMSINRAILVWFPLWAALGLGVAWRPRRFGLVKNAAVGLGVALSAALMMFWAWLFFTGHWAS